MDLKKRKRNLGYGNEFDEGEREKAQSEIGHAFLSFSFLFVGGGGFKEECGAAAESAASPLRGDSTGPSNIYATAEIQIALYDFLSSSLAVIGPFFFFF